MLLVNVVATFTVEGHWTAMIYYISRSRLKLKKMLSTFYALLRFAAFKKAVAETSSTSVSLALRVEPKPKSGIRQQDLLKRVVEVKPKHQRVSKPSDKDPSLVTLSGQTSKKHKDASIQHGNKKEQSPSKEDETLLDDNNPVKSLLAAYGSLDDEN